MLIWYKLDDYAFEKFGLEDEDFHALWKEKMSGNFYCSIQMEG
mgnify:CR=1 FL=1